MAISDRWLFLIFYPLCALATIHIGNDNSLSELLAIPSYYSDLLIAFGISYSSGFYVRFVSGRLSQIHKGQLKTAARLHFLYGVLPPLCFAIIIEIIYLQTLQISLRESSIFYLETPLILLFLLFSNLFYLVRDIYSFQEQKLVEMKSGNKKTKAYKTHLMVSRGATSRVIEVNDVSHIEFSDKVTYVVTVEGEKFVVNEALQSIYEELDPSRFYMLNRQMIVNKTTINGYVQMETRKLLVKLKVQSLENTFVSKARAGDFIRWLKSI